MLSPGQMSKEDFVDGRPSGITLHYLADRSVNRAHQSLLENGLGYHLIIDRLGSVYQTAFLTKRVDHAGKALWNDKSPNRFHVGIALASWGRLNVQGTAFYSWAGTEISMDEVAARKSNIDGRLYAWDAATDVQEEKLWEVLRWFIVQGIDPKNICDHSECALPPGRKLDIGGVLSATMEEIRQRLSASHMLIS